MNILITGLQATGKSTIGKALKMYYESLGDNAVLYDDGENPTTSEAVAIARHDTAVKRTLSTQRKPHKHTIVVSQLPIDTSVFDYVCKTARLSGAR